MSGMMLDLSQVPDPAFSKKFLGDGYACAVNGSKVTAPFDGEVIAVFRTGHAVALKDHKGVEVLLHIGIDTVKLNGEGFQCHVEKGQTIRKNDLLLELDLDIISKAKSLISPIVFTNGLEIQLLKENQMLTNGEADLFAVLKEGA